MIGLRVGWRVWAAEGRRSTSQPRHRDRRQRWFAGASAEDVLVTTAGAQIAGQRTARVPRQRGGYGRGRYTPKDLCGCRC